MVTVWNELREYVIQSAWAHISPEYQTELGKDDTDFDDRGDDGRWSG
jgi:hypothetical protein